MQYKENETVCREGDFANALYIVKKGTLEGTSIKTGEKNTYGPGSIIGEFCLVENLPMRETITAQSDSELERIESEAFKESLKEEPSWISSIVQFLSQRVHIAENDFRKSLRVRSLPALLYLLFSMTSNMKGSSNQELALSEIREKMKHLVNLPEDLTMEILAILSEMDLLKLQTNSVTVKNRNVVGMLYQAILFRAVHKAAAPSILSLTEQMVLNAFIKAAQESTEPLKNGICTVTSEKLAAITRKVTFGMTLTLSSIQPLIKKNILTSTPNLAEDVSAPVESVETFSGDLDKALDLMELNRIFPLLDKKLVE